MIVLRGGRLYDPANGVEGLVRDVWMADGRIIPPPAHPETVQEIDARGWWLAPGAVEIHTHIAGAPLRLARGFSLRELDEGVPLVPPPAVLGEAYLRMGYTAVFDAAMPPLLASLTHHDFSAMTSLDRGAYTLVGDHDLVLDAVRSGDSAALRDVLAWLLECSGGYALKLVNPAAGREHRDGSPTGGLDEISLPVGLSQRRVLLAVARAAQELALPHPVHMHAADLGKPGSWRGFCETAAALEGLPAHFCHIQFYCYGEGAHGGIRSAVREVVESISAYGQLSFDIGQVVFGPALVVTADQQAVGNLKSVKNPRWAAQALEGEGEMGGMALDYLARNPVGAVQWAAGLELLLRFPDPSRLFLTTDFPNGGPFTAYPSILALLMDAEYRAEQLSQVHPAARTQTGLAELEREYTFGEVVAMTSWGPARALGLRDRGHLAPGAVADVRCYRAGEDPQKMFRFPALVVKSGQVILQDGARIASPPGRTLVCRPAWDRARLPRFQDWAHELLTLSATQYGWPGREQAGNVEEVPCRSEV